MPPRASTSAHTLESAPGFRTSRPRRARAKPPAAAAAAAEAPKRRFQKAGAKERSSGSRKGKERAAEDEYPLETKEQEQEEEEALLLGEYEPQRGQLRRKPSRRNDKRARMEDEDSKAAGRRVKRRKTDREDFGADPEQDEGGLDVQSLAPPSLSASQTTGATPPPSSSGARTASQKRVRIAQVPASGASDPTSGAEHDSEAALDPPLGLGGGFSRGATLVNGLPPGAHNATGPEGEDHDEEAEEDWADPLTVPSALRVRSQRYWQWLELGTFTSALHDVAGAENHLGRALVEWELLRLRRADEERQEEAEARGDQSPETARGIAGTSSITGSRGTTPIATPSAGTPQPEQDDASDPEATPRPHARKPRGAPARTHDPYRALTPFPLSSETAHRLGTDEDGVNLLPLPSSVALAKMSRWPVNSTSLGAREEEEGLGDAGEASRSNGLEEALLAHFERAARAQRAHVPLRRKRTRARSAYDPGGPLYTGTDRADEDSTSDDDNSSTADLDLDDTDLDELEALPALLARVPATVDSILTRMLDLVPKAPLPAYDRWTEKTRSEELRKDDRRQGFVRDECAPGWEEVLAIAREQDVSRSVVDKLEAQLVALFGEPKRGPTSSLPPAGLADQFVVRMRQRSREDSVQDDETDPVRRSFLSLSLYAVGRNGLTDSIPPW
ncbi:hypothetical protein JCM8202_005982 [Rhodotorula sphaerocarpa]